ncbi:MAG: lysine--tRNA ligase [Promethearchaeota archaeon]
MASTLARIREQRLAKVRKLRELGIDPYPARAERSHENKELFDNFEKFKGKEVTVVGRIMSWREHGALKFAHIQDFFGKIQLIFKKDALLKFNKKEQRIGWKEISLIDIGDFVQAKGVLTKSKTGEISVEVRSFKLLTKAIRPLPEKRIGIKDKEIRFRRRYLDLTINPDQRGIFAKKTKFWNATLEYMNNHGFYQVQTPILEETTGGADASPFITHHNVLDQDFYLRISPELHLKRLIGGGFEKIYDFGPVFRNEGIDDEHAQDYWHIEYYWAYADYNDGMDFVRDLIRYSAQKAFETLKFETRGYKFDLSKEWKKIDYIQVIKERFGVDIFKTPNKKMYEIIKKEGIDIEFENNRNRLVDNLWKIIRKEISGPAFLINEPKFMSPLAKSKPEDTRITERFHVLVAGSENGNGYSEINDPIDQYERFKEQQDMRDAGDDEAQMMDIDYVEMLEYGMPPCTGYAHSERLFWFLADLTAREGVFFPLTKTLFENTTKEIYHIEEPRKVTGIAVKKFEQKLKQLRSNITLKELDQIDNPKIISIDKGILEKFENINIGIAIIRGVNIEKSNNELFDLKKNVVTSIGKVLSEEEVDDIPQIESYFNMYKQMGVDTHSRKASPEALLRNILSGGVLTKVNTCVDAYNIAVLLTQISAGAFDLKNIKSPVTVREAKNGEQIKIIGSETKKLKKGEVCYFDKKGPYNMDYNFRDAERTKVTEKTKDLWINVEGVNSITREQVADALKLTVELITRYCGGEVELIGMVKTNQSREQNSIKLNKFNELEEIEPGITRKRALELVKKHTKNENLVKHMLASEAAMRGYAKHYVKKGKLHKNNIETWALAGLLHDIMFEKDPEGHMFSGAELLKKEGVSDYITHAIEVHGNDDGSKHITHLDKVLLVTEECTGLVVAATLVLPSKKLKDLKLESLVKRFGEKGFAAKLNRDNIQAGCERIDKSVEEHLGIVLKAMQGISDELGL